MEIELGQAVSCHPVITTVGRIEAAKLTVDERQSLYQAMSQDGTAVDAHNLVVYDISKLQVQAANNHYRKYTLRQNDISKFQDKFVLLTHLLSVENGAKFYGQGLLLHSIRTEDFSLFPLVSQFPPRIISAPIDLMQMPVLYQKSEDVPGLYVIINHKP